MKQVLYIGILTLAIGAAFYEARRAAESDAVIRVLKKERAKVEEEAAHLRHEQERAANRVAAVLAENEQLRRSVADLPKLRGEVTELHKAAQQNDSKEAQEPMEDGFARSVLDLSARAGELNLYLRQSKPQWRIPEFQYLSADAWLAAAKEVKLDSEESVRRAAEKLRSQAKAEFGKRMGHALEKYVRSNNGQLPSEPSLLKPWFENPINDAVLERYEMLQSGSVVDLPKDAWVISEKAPVDNIADSHLYVGPSRSGVFTAGAKSKDPDKSWIARPPLPVSAAVVE